MLGNPFALDSDMTLFEYVSVGKDKIAITRAIIEVKTRYTFPSVDMVTAF